MAAFKPGQKPGIAPFKLGFQPQGVIGKTGPSPPVPSFLKPGAVVSPAIGKPGAVVTPVVGKPGAVAPAAMKPGTSIPVPQPMKPAEAAIPAKLNPAPVVSEAEANQLMGQVNAEMSARANLDLELQQLTKEAEDSVLAQIPQNVEAFKQACSSQLQQFSGYSGQVSSTVAGAAELARQARQEVSSSSIRSTGPQTPLNTDELSQALNDILAQAQASFSELFTAYEGIYSADVSALGEYANAQWGVFDAKYQAVAGKMEEVKAKYSQSS